MSNLPAGNSSPGPLRKAAFTLIAFCITMVAVEIASRLAYRVIYKQAFDHSTLHDSRKEIVDTRKEERTLPETSSKSGNSKIRREVLHPYLGFVVDYNELACPDFGFCDRRMRKNPNSPMQPTSDDDFVVVITGGSFAYGVSISSSEDLIENKLRTIPALSDRNIVVHTLAHGGYKQPQQLMALSYFLSLGADFDMIINIDGFNEVALPPAENLPRYTNPFFPRAWYNRVTINRDTALLSRYGGIEFLKDRRARLARRANRTSLEFTAAYNLYWKIRNQRLSQEIQELEKQAANYKVKNKHILPFVARGPEYETRTTQDLYRELAAQWRRSSTQMHALSAAAGIRYYHFLQPNQYLEGSKPMGEQEISVAIYKDHPYSTGVVDGYPELRRQGAALKSTGIQFHDMTQLLADNDSPLYIDACCHLNREGYDIFVADMVERIAADFSSDPEGTNSATGRSNQ